MKTINESWYKFFSRVYWQRATRDPDLMHDCTLHDSNGIRSPLGISIAGVHYHAPNGWVGFTALFRGGNAESKGND